ncbi:unnamed protein product, partial [Prorocentrum cordatum]
MGPFRAWPAEWDPWVKAALATSRQQRASAKAGKLKWERSSRAREAAAKADTDCFPVDERAEEDRGDARRGATVPENAPAVLDALPDAEPGAELPGRAGHRRGGAPQLYARMEGRGAVGASWPIDALGCVLPELRKKTRAVALVGKSAVAAVPVAGAGFATIGPVFHETSLGAPGKTGAVDDAVAIDGRWLRGPLLGLKAASHPDRTLLNFSSELRREALAAMADGPGPGGARGPLDHDDVAHEVRKGHLAASRDQPDLSLVFSFGSEVPQSFRRAIQGGVGGQRGQLLMPVLLESGAKREVSRPPSTLLGQAHTLRP